MKPPVPNSASLDLPPADAAAREVSATLRERIEAEIRTAGPMSLERFWEWAMYAPGLGYYSNGSCKFGAAGDFVTAPELGSVFGRCLAQPVSEVLAALENEGRILELGGGTGAMAATLLQDLEARDALPRQYAIVEVSADLKDRQRHALARWGDRVRWLDAPPSEGWRGVLLANEVVDALPARRFRRTESGWVERRIGAADGDFHWLDYPASSADLARLEQLVADAGRTLPPGYQTEYQPRLPAWLEAVADGLREGLALFIDYGYPRREYYHPQRTTGTLIAHYRHRAHEDVLSRPGLQDLSVNVEFTALAEAATGAGLELLGYTTLAWFLLACGLERIVAEGHGRDERDRARLLHEVKLLTLPAEMGERFQVLAAGRGLSSVPTGFAHDRRERL